MRGFVAGLVIVPVVVVALLSIRPGGLRRQLANAVRRLRLVLVLAGLYLLGSGIVRLLVPNTAIEEFGLPLLALGLALAFIVLGQDPPPENAV